jgi:ABC-2 type transport system ATP-binding protein
VERRAAVRFSLDGEQRVESVADPTRFVRELFAEHGAAVGDLEVRRVRLEEIYLEMVREFEAGGRTDAPGELVEVGR